MAFAKRYVAGFTDSDVAKPCDAQALNAFEAALLALYSINPAVDDVGIWDGTKFAPGKLANAQISPTAAIPYSKLDLAHSLTDDEFDDGILSVTKLAPGSAGQILTIVGGVATWAASSTTAAIPTGAVFFTAASTPPTGFILTDGSEISRITYADLFTAISTTYGAGNGTTTFNVPDLRGRVIAGKGTHTDVDALNKNDGNTVGNRTPSHRHSYTAPSNFVKSSYSGGAEPATSATNYTSGNASNIDKPSFIVLNGIIKT